MEVLFLIRWTELIINNTLKAYVDEHKHKGFCIFMCERKRLDWTMEKNVAVLLLLLRTVITWQGDNVQKTFYVNT